MSSDFQLISTDTTALLSALIAAYEAITGRTLQPASPDRLFLSWVADAILQTRAQINYAANQNIPSRAGGANLDALGELFYNTARPQAQAAACVVRFSISAAQPSSILIPAGTKVTDAGRTLDWATEADTYIAIGETTADIPVLCQTPGAAGNGYTAGQINKIIDLFPFASGCANITISDGGADIATDAEYVQLLRASQSALSTAGPLGGYVYWAKSASTDIADVIPMMPKDPSTGELMGGHVYIYALMGDGTIASETIKGAILEKCNQQDVRPLTDFVSVQDPVVVDYNISFTYYIPTDTALSAAEIQQAVDNAVAGYIAWQRGKLGRDINPSHLISLLMATGVKRVEIAQPVFTVLSDGTDHTAPAVARVADITVINGGYENE